MAITIRNKRTEAMIRAIGAETGEGPSAVISRAIDSLRAGNNGEKDAKVAEHRLAAMRQLAEEYPLPANKPSWEEIERDMDEMFDYLYEDDPPR